MIEDKLNQIEQEIIRGTSILGEVVIKLEKLSSIIESCPHGKGCDNDDNNREERIEGTNSEIGV